MRGFIQLFFGAFLLLAGGVGILRAFDGTLEKTAQSIVNNGVDTTGIIEKREKVTVKAGVGKIRGLGSYYTMTYSFTTLEGKKYGSTINVSEEDAYTVRDGQKITVRYNKQTPTVNAALGFKDYFSQEDVENQPTGLFVGVGLFMLLGGVWLCWAGWRNVQPMFGNISFGGASNHALPQSRLDSVNRPNVSGFGRR